MPRVFEPRRSDAHRVACFSLYRGLLQQCSKLSKSAASHPIPASTLQNLVRYRFGRDRKLQSPRQIVRCLDRGYSVLSILHNASAGSQSDLTSLLHTLQSSFDHASQEASQREKYKRIARPPSPRLKPKVGHLRERACETSQQEASPNTTPLSEHPLPLPLLKSSRRVVPQLAITARNIPFLRYTRKHIPFLSRILRHKTKQLSNNLEVRFGLEYALDLGKAEDAWDVLLQSKYGSNVPSPAFRDGPVESSDPSIRNQGGPSRQPFSNPGNSEDTFEHAVLWARESGRRIFAQRTEGYRAQATRMWEIVKQERQLKQWEDIPFRLANVIKRTRRLEEQVRRFAEMKGVKLSEIRLWSEVRMDINEVLAIGPLSIPMEWVKDKKMDEEGRGKASIGELQGERTTPETMEDGKTDTRTPLEMLEAASEAASKKRSR